MSGRDEENAQLRAALAASNAALAENRSQMMGMASMFDMIAESDPRYGQMWSQVRPTIVTQRTAEEQADLERRTENRSSELREDLNL